jgi:pyruvate formate lyase activating enzyme
MIFDLRRFSIHDGPGLRSTVFFKGCPLRCLWCHNPESQDPRPERIEREERCLHCGACLEACPQGAIAEVHGRLLTDSRKCTRCGACAEACYAEARQIAGRPQTAAQVLAEIERDQIFYDQSGGGATFSGGEPLLQPDFLLDLLWGCRERGIHTALDTCGQAAWETLQRIHPAVDLFLYDLKLMDSARHTQCTGVSNERILENLRRLAAAGCAIWLRVPVIPGLNDDRENLDALGTFAASLPGIQQVTLLPYHRAAASKYERLGSAYSLAEVTPPDEAAMTEVAQALAAFGLPVRLE